MLLLSEIIHFSTALLIGFLISRRWGKPKLVYPAAIFGAFLVDIDHLVDYFLAFGFDFNLIQFLSGYHFLISDKLYIPLHGWEVVLLFLLFFWWFTKKKSNTAKIIFLILSISLFTHLVEDVFTNRGLTAKTYSLVYRASNNFEIEEIVTSEHWEKHLKMKEELAK